MCGIAGFIDPRIDTRDAPALLERMLESIAHRGPDARGTYFQEAMALGHNRLSIIDLSEEANQPMHYFDACIVYNGEIYNYREIREGLVARGYRFTTQSDTEVILAAFREYGEDCVQHFVGMWSFALWDKQEKYLFCSRDRFGIKPFFYLHQGERFYFGSEYKALKPSPLFSNDVNWSQVSRGLQLGWNTYADETYFKKLNALPAASNLIYRNGALTIKQYWDIPEGKLFHGSAHEKSEHFRELFMESIRLHMRSDVEVGGCLSGGLDSSAIASAVAKKFPNASFQTFTVYYDGENEVDERPWANEVVNKYPVLQPHFMKPSAEQVANSFERAVYHADVPVAGSSPLSQYFVMELAAQHKIKVLLDGQGSDEYLGGYMHSFYRLIGGLIGSRRPVKAWSELSAHASMQQMNVSKKRDVLLKSLVTMMMPEQKAYGLEYKSYFPFLGPDQPIPFHLKHRNESSLKQFLYHLLFTTSLPTLLQFEDRNSMAFSIESRVPFLDHRLVEFAFSLRDDDLIYKGETKSILRKSMKGVLPDAIINRKDKKGFVTPGEVKWLRGPLKFLLDTDFKKLDNLHHQKTRKLIDDFNSGENSHANLVWRVALLNYWIGKI
ncbi:MAG TPA: asparagine synthase (glutamine-hydrolyzing) [Bacteroidia bacterium]|nr:asparagine synthase (glutamine-hydrolyzing) [Bacteroidia bacterium]